MSASRASRRRRGLRDANLASEHGRQRLPAEADPEHRDAVADGVTQEAPPRRDPAGLGVVDRMARAHRRRSSRTRRGSDGTPSSKTLATSKGIPRSSSQSPSSAGGSSVSFWSMRPSAMASERDVDGLGLEIGAQPLEPALAAEPGLLPAAEGRAGAACAPGVDVDRPASSSAASRCALEMSRVQTPAARPYSLSFARFATSSSESYGWATSTGPKISSRTIVARSFSVVKTVGSTNQPASPLAPPPTRSSASSRPVSM